MSSKEFPSPSDSVSLTSTFTRWTVHSAYAKNDAEIRALFETVFGHPMSQAQWEWKYADTDLKGVFLKTTADESVAFFGGMPRKFFFHNQAYDCVQNGDVMVLPSERGVFSKKGALYQTASSFFNHHVGSGRKYVFAFGFPNLRHFTLGVKLGLYEPMGAMKELRWPIAIGRYSMWWSWHVANQVQDIPMASLWGQMRASWPQVFVAQRDARRWSYRYEAHPSIRYTLLAVRSNLTRKTVAAVVLREHDGYWELMDFVGARRQVGKAIQAAREFAAIQQKTLYLLVSDAVSSDFSVAGAVASDSSIQIPTNLSVNDVKNKPWLGNLCLMAGDSDFM